MLRYDLADVSGAVQDSLTRPLARYERVLDRGGKPRAFIRLPASVYHMRRALGLN